MRVGVTLMGMYRDRTPPDGSLDVPDSACVRDVLIALDIPHDHVQIVSINNEFEKDLDRRLAADDEVTILPTVTGG